MAEKTTPLPRTVFNWLRWFAALATLALAAHAADWPKIDKAELAETKSAIDPEADSEILLREVSLDHFTFIETGRGATVINYGPSGTEDRHFLRIKVFTEKGVKQNSLIRITCDTDAKITGVAARTIKPDGTVVEVNKDDIKERDFREKNGRRVKMKTFALPSIVPGAIIEYRYTITSGRPNFVVMMDFQSRMPSRLVRFKMGLIKCPDAQVAHKYTLHSVGYNCPLEKLSPKNGFVTIEKTNLPAIKPEPFAPPFFTTATTLIVYLENVSDKTPGTYWEKCGKNLHRDLTNWTKDSPAITAAAAAIVEKSDADETKLQKIYDWCRTEIVNRSRETTKLTKEERQKIKRNHTAADVLQAKSGNASDVNFLFAALAKAAGFDVRLVACNNRTAVPFNEAIMEIGYMLPDRSIAVQIGSDWRFFNPGASYLAFGMLPERNSGTTVLISDSSGALPPAAVPAAPPEASALLRKGSFVLHANGTLEGDITEIYSGLLETKMKDGLDALSAEQRVEVASKELKKVIKHAVFSNVSIENADRPTGQFKATYHIKIPNYATRTGERLFLQPAVFQKDRPAQFTAAERKHPIILPFRFTEKDEFRFTVPEGCTLEAGNAPQDIDAQGLCRYGTVITANKVTGELTYQREFTLTNLSFKSAAYPKIKEVLDQVRLQDSHTLTLKRPAGAADTEDSTTPDVSKTPAGEADKDDDEME